MNRVSEQVLGHPAIQRLKRVAQALGDLNDVVVFIGGAISPLLQTEPPFDEPRPTKDVDGVIASTRYSEIEPLHESLRARGFRQTLGETKHLHRWYSPVELRAFVAVQTVALLDDEQLEDLLAGHLNNAQDPRATMELVRRRMEAIGGLGEKG